MKSRFQIIAKSIQIPCSKEIQTSDPLLLETYFFLAIRCNKELASQVLPNFKVPRISSEFLTTFYPYKVL
jgi:hypothetical protein